MTGRSSDASPSAHPPGSARCTEILRQLPAMGLCRAPAESASDSSVTAFATSRPSGRNARQQAVEHLLRQPATDEHPHPAREEIPSSFRRRPVPATPASARPATAQFPLAAHGPPVPRAGSIPDGARVMGARIHSMATDSAARPDIPEQRPAHRHQLSPPWPRGTSLLRHRPRPTGTARSSSPGTRGQTAPHRGGKPGTPPASVFETRALVVPAFRHAVEPRFLRPAHTRSTVMDDRAEAPARSGKRAIPRGRVRARRQDQKPRVGLDEGESSAPPALPLQPSASRHPQGSSPSARRQAGNADSCG